MSLAVFVVVAFAFAGLGIALRGRSRLTAIAGLAGLIATTVAAAAIDPADVLIIDGSGLATTAYLRLFLLLGSLAGLGLAVAGLAGGTRRDAPAVTLGILGAAGLTLGLVDSRAAVLAATVGGLFGVLVTLVPRGGRVGRASGSARRARSSCRAASPSPPRPGSAATSSQLAAQPVVFGLAYLAFAVAVAMRFGAIPFHLWAARLTDVVPETSQPILTALAPASLAIVALAWVDASIAPLLVDLAPERALVIAIAIVSIVFAALAAFVQDDIEHILGYSIVGDAGVVVLALAALDPEVWAPARMWILAFVVARCAFAAWCAGIRAGFWTGRVADLRGWARRSPFLAIAFVLVVIAGVGFPGLVAFDARTAIVELALDTPLTTLVLIGTLLPIAYYGRLLVIGLSRPDRVLDPVNAWRPQLTLPDLTGLGRWLRMTWISNRAFTTGSVAILLGLLALATSAGAFGGPAAAAGLAPDLGEPTDGGAVVAGPSPSGSAAP